MFTTLKYKPLYSILVLTAVVAIFRFFSGYPDPAPISPLNEVKPRSSHPYEDYFLSRQHPQAGAGLEAYDRALEAVARFDQNLSARTQGSWVVEGPGNIGARVNTLAVDPKDPSVIFAGFSEGGLFRTINGGSSWEPVFDTQNRLSIGSVVIDPFNSNIIYAGTGDPNVSGYPFIGDGLYRSEDGGETWQYLGLRDTRIISRVRISNSNPNVIYVSAMGLPFEKNIHRGLYRSSDGGATWNQILHINDSTGVSDFVIHPQNHNIVYATGWNRIRNNKKSLVSGPDAKIYKSTDGGQNWRILQNGLPMDRSSRIGIDICLSNPQVLFACYADASNFNLKGIFRSDDAGESWQEMPIGPNAGLDPGVYGGFGWYFGKIRINPSNPDDVYLLAVDLFRSQDGGQTWTEATPPWWQYDVHADKHDLIFASGNIYLGTDGGVYKADLNAQNWQDIENIPTTQFYRVGYNPNRPDLYYGGAQDNGTSGGNNVMIDQWERIYGGDGFQCLFHPTDENIFYVETQNGGVAVTKDGGLSFEGALTGINSAEPRNWDMPVVLSSHNPNVLYTGTNRIYINTKGPDAEWVPISQDITDINSNWFRHNISTIHESPVRQGYVAAGTSDARVWVTADNGVTWKNIKEGLPDRYVSSVQFSPTDKNTLYVAFTGYKDNDNSPYIFRSRDLGTNWEPIQDNLPPIAVNNILILPQVGPGSDSRICLATDAGVYYTADAGVTWLRMGDNMPVITVYDLEYNSARNQVVAGTFGRSIQSFDLSQIGYNTGVADPLPGQPCSPVLENSVLSDNCILRLKTDCEEVAWKWDYLVSDLSGKVCLKGRFSNRISEIDASSLIPGVYMLALSPSGTSKPKNTFKFVRL